MTSPAATGAALDQHAQHLWGLAYRLTGSAADADDIVQETFVRALASPRTRTDEDGLRPWLVSIATNVSLDALRKRRRLGYVGPWLPEPVDTGELAAGEETEPQARYDLLESVSFAFLIALEALTPRARAVLVLRDVLDYSAKETAEALGSTEAAVKVTLHRARRLMESYDANPCVPTRELQEKTRAVLQALLMHLAAGDVSALTALLADDVRTLNDSNGAYHAARLPVIGGPKVARFWMNIRPKGPASLTLRMLNGLPALVGVLESPPSGIAPRTAVLLRLGALDLVTEIHGIVAPPKLTHVFAH